MTKCPMCGYNEANPNRSQHQYMNQYRSKKTGEICIINSHEPVINAADGDTLTILGIKENPNAQIPKTANLKGIPMQSPMLPTPKAIEPVPSDVVDFGPPKANSPVSINNKPQQP